MMNSEEELERYRSIGRLVELIHHIPTGRLKSYLVQLEKETSEKEIGESERRHVRVDCFVSVDYTDSEKIFKDYIVLRPSVFA